MPKCENMLIKDRPTHEFEVKYVNKQSLMQKRKLLPMKI